MSLFCPETMIAATESSPSSNLSSAHHTLPHPPSTINLELEEPAFAVTQDVTNLQSPSSEEGTYCMIQLRTCTPPYLAPTNKMKSITNL